ncbi:MAG: UxaA family hydrolase, partial [Verrucomicrobia bacterium]|nr:UxaA family hydrolase [Verrucomicrobiota bacterium]
QTQRVEVNALHLLRASDSRFATEQVALVLPASLCSTQIARLAAERLNERQFGRAQGISRFVGFTHTEGCGFGGETMYQLLHRTYRGYLTHPNVAAALVLEHGCEKVPNDVLRHQLTAAGVDPRRFGWASVQLDGGIANALDKIEAWFAAKLAALPVATATTADLGALSLALVTTAPVEKATADALAQLASQVLHRGGTILVAESDHLLAHRTFTTALLGATEPALSKAEGPHATLAYGQPAIAPGLHIVATESEHFDENVTGLAGCGAHAVLAVVSDHARQGHPLVPVLQVAEPAQRSCIPADDIDLFLGDRAADVLGALEHLLVRVVQRERIPVANARGFVDFQLTRGLLGLTT